MKKNEIDELLLNANVALEHEKYPVAMEYLEKALALDPENLTILSKAGAVSVALQKYDRAFECFKKAVQLDPENGDNEFNLGNAYFFKGNYTDAFLHYVKADSIGCSDDVQLQLYYQLMLLCIARMELDNAYVYLKKCEEEDRNGDIVMKPDFLTEKIKICMIRKDFDAATECAAVLVHVDPTNFGYYNVYFSLLMAAKNYRKAKDILDTSAQYAKDDDEKISLATQSAAYAIEMAEQDPSQRDKFYQEAINHLLPWADQSRKGNHQYLTVITTLCDLYNRSEKYDEAIRLADSVLHVVNQPTVSNLDLNSKIEVKTPPEPDDAEIFARVQQDDAALNDALACADFSALDLCEVEMDENGVYQHIIPDDWLPQDHADQEMAEEPRSDPEEEIYEELTEDIREALLMSMASSYLGKNDYVHVAKITKLLLNSKNSYTAYFAHYVSALAVKHTSKDSAQVQKKFDTEIAYFRSRMAENYQDSLAASFRARLYAECGKYKQAKELAALLSDEESARITEYIDKIQKKH